MITLALDTSTARGSVAVLRDDKPLAEQTFSRGAVVGRVPSRGDSGQPSAPAEGSGPTTDLFSTLAAVAASPVRGGPSADLPRAGSRLQIQFDQIVVGVGPGSFTGIRAGIAAAKGLSLPGGVPVLPACSFDAIARNALPAMPQDCLQMCVFSDAKRDEVYSATYDRQGNRTGGCRLGPLEAIELHNPVWFVSAEVERYRDALREILGGFASVCERPVFPSAALLRPENLPLEPIYLRTPQYKKL